MEPETSTTISYHIEYLSSDDDQWYEFTNDFVSRGNAIDYMKTLCEVRPDLKFRVSKLTTTIEHEVITE
jgi:hypothetical protein